LSYKERLDKQVKNSPNKTAELFFDTNYKIAVLEKLLTDGEVESDDLLSEIKMKYGIVDKECFNNAFAVIKDYVETGGSGVVGGRLIKD